MMKGGVDELSVKTQEARQLSKKESFHGPEGKGESYYMKTTGVDRKEVDSSIYRKPMCDQAPKGNQKPINRSASPLTDFGYSCTNAGCRLAANKRSWNQDKTENGCGSRWIFWKGMNLL